ncbi:WD40 repeat-like protein [Trametes versicolor FP-101664 SS1]|uniref:WD40 repeat-like protein n=1 Tax=Trametes versicolor (strain FP-101664) TaxID=717944 RepID=UPI00046212EF|nr:WD40 repeat-like protein [Trametes versicolor FP-101664 SS1]EIW60223.1 WD40 repeat-like protein [Trametes versicolor FP-101664 SS1]
MTSNPRPSLYLAPSVNTTTVVTTTTTTTTYAPIQLPPIPPPSSPKDPKLYPLLNATLPRSLREFPLVFPGGSRATFHDGELGEQEMQEEESVVEGQGWKMIKRDESEPRKEVGLAEAIERYGRKRSYSNENMMEGIEAIPGLVTNTPPRKKAKSHPPPINTINNAAPPSPLPSPHGSPPPESIWPSAPPSGHSSPQPQAQAPVQPDLSLTTLLALPSLLSHFSSLPPSLQSHVLLTFLRHSPLSVLRTLHSVLTPTLARDFLTLLPPELVSLILSFLPFPDLARASRVSKSWRAIIDSDPVLWRDLLKGTRIWFGHDSETAFSDAIMARRRRQGIPASNSLPLPHPYKILFKSRHLTRSRWVTNQEPKRLTFPAHGRSVVTCLIFSHGRIISASDDHSIHVYSPVTGTLIRSLDGHDGGVWALAATKNTLVSGSTDRTVRIWDLETGRCTHVFGGHTSTVRCLAIVKPEMIDYENEHGIMVREKWPKRPLIVTGSRDHSLRVWTLPRPGDEEYRCYGADDTEVDPSEEDVDDNPYHKLHLEGHDHAVRALAARGRTLVSGSYDCTVRIWDIITGDCKWVLVGHTQKVYSVVLDINRNLACSGSMDGTVRVWNLSTGQCQHILAGHTSLVGLLGLSPSYLVSAAADSTLRVWDPDSGELRHTLAAHSGAITCFQHDEFKVLSGSDGTLKMWDIRDGTQVRDLLTGIVGVWQVVFEGRWCVAASNRMDSTVLDVWDFGNDEDEDWEGEPPGGLYDEESDYDEEEEEDLDRTQAEVDAMDQDLDGVLSDAEFADADQDQELGTTDDDDHEGRPAAWRGLSLSTDADDSTKGSTSRETSASHYRSRSSARTRSQREAPSSAGPSEPQLRMLPTLEETPTRPRTRNAGHRRRWQP